MKSRLLHLASLILIGAMATSAPAFEPAARDGAKGDEGKPKPWTVLIYGAADNNADGPIFGFLGDVRRAIADDPAFNLVFFVDRARGFSTSAEGLGQDFTGGRLYEVHEKTADRLEGGEEFPEMKLDAEFEPDSADPAMLRKFIRFGKARFPAQHYALIIYSHASGISMCPDEESGRDMGFAELTEATGEEDAVDFTGLELCNMGGIEIAYQWRPGNGGFSTEVLLAIPNAGPPLDWDRIFGRLHAPGTPAAKGRTDVVDPAKLSAREFGRIAVEEGLKGRLAAIEARPEAKERMAHESGAAYDLNVVEPVKQAMDELAVALWQAKAKAAFCELRRPGTPEVVMNYVGNEIDGDRPFVDLYDLLERAANCTKLDATVQAKVKATQAAIERFMIGSFAMSGYPGFEAGKNGVFIVFPNGDAPRAKALSGASRAWGSLKWYSPFEVKDGKTINGNLAWCRDGATVGDEKVEGWFELLDAWFDTGNDKDGGLNGYRW